MANKAQIAICGAGIAGVTTTYYLAVKCRQLGVVLVDRLQPLSLTTGKSGENIRDYWPQACMAALSDHSIELMEELPTPVVQMAGYYSRTVENWPLIGPLEVEGSFAVAALSGFGTMAACWAPGIAGPGSVQCPETVRARISPTCG